MLKCFVLKKSYLSRMEVGRPKSALDLWDGWHNDILEMYRIGASDVEIKALIWEHRGSFSNDLWERWLEEEPQFSETIKTGKILSEAAWTKQGRENLTKKEFNYVGWYMNMKNRFNWSDNSRQEISGPNGKPVSATVVFTPATGCQPIKDDPDNPSTE